jgi:hypothetical protein
VVKGLVLISVLQKKYWGGVGTGKPDGLMSILAPSRGSTH